jgi:hypothetical protein
LKIISCLRCNWMQKIHLPYQVYFSEVIYYLQPLLIDLSWYYIIKKLDSWKRKSWEWDWGKGPRGNDKTSYRTIPIYKLFGLKTVLSICIRTEILMVRFLSSNRPNSNLIFVGKMDWFIEMMIASNIRTFGCFRLQTDRMTRTDFPIYGLYGQMGALVKILLKIVSFY